MKQAIKEHLQLLKKKYEKIGFKMIGVFGSYARGNQTPQSDLDIVYEVDASFVKHYSGWASISKLEEIKREIAQSLCIEKVDLVPTDTPNKTLQKILQNKLIHV